MGDVKSLGRPGRKQATTTENFDFHISYLKWARWGSWGLF